MSDRSVDILLVEDNPVDVKLTMEALKTDRVHNKVHLARDGEEALDYLFKRNGHQNAVRPDIILLDLNLPKIDGRQVLQQIKSAPALRRIPVVMLTSSSADEDILRSYDLNVNCYITKPVDFNRFVETVKAIIHFWFSVASLPKS